jgi:hypothetical protein
MHHLVRRAAPLLVSFAVATILLLPSGVARATDTRPASIGHAIASGAKSPAPRQFAGMVYDAARSEIVLFGGKDADDVYLGDT